MFGRKKKKAEKTDNRPKLSDLPPEKQARVLADFRKRGDELVARFQAIMDGSLEVAKAAVDERIGSPDNGDGK